MFIFRLIRNFYNQLVEKRKNRLRKRILHCPNCPQVVGRLDNYCRNCKTVLAEPADLTKEEQAIKGEMFERGRKGICGYDHKKLLPKVEVPDGFKRDPRMLAAFCPECGHEECELIG